MINTG